MTRVWSPTALETLSSRRQAGLCGTIESSSHSSGGCPGPCPRPAGTIPSLPVPSLLTGLLAVLLLKAGSLLLESAAAPGEMFSLRPEKQTQQEALPLQDDTEKRIRLTGGEEPLLAGGPGVSRGH